MPRERDDRTKGVDRLTGVTRLYPANHPVEARFQGHLVVSVRFIPKAIAFLAHNFDRRGMGLVA